MEDIDPSVLQEMAGLMQGGMPDPNKLRALMKKNPALKDMVQGMMGGGMGGRGDRMAGRGMGGVSPSERPTPYNGRARSLSS